MVPIEFLILFAKLVVHCHTDHQMFPPLVITRSTSGSILISDKLATKPQQFSGRSYSFAIAFTCFPVDVGGLGSVGKKILKNIKKNNF